MRIEIDYATQVRTTVGVRGETLELTEGATLRVLLKRLCEVHPSIRDSWVADDGTPRAGLLVFVNDESRVDSSHYVLNHGDRVSLMTMVSGG